VWNEHQPYEWWPLVWIWVYAQSSAILDAYNVLPIFSATGATPTFVKADVICKFFSAPCGNTPLIRWISDALSDYVLVVGI